jgi:hypothetical protein
MRKLREQEVKNIKKQLGGDVELFESPRSDASDRSGPSSADARVPSLDTLRGSSFGSARSSQSDAFSSLATKKGKAGKRGSNPGKGDFSVRFKKKNTDGGSKVAIVSSKLNKVVYEQG